MARRVLISLAVVALVLGSTAATAQPRGGGGGGAPAGGASGRGPGGGPSGGPGGGAWHGGGGYGGNWHGGGGYGGNWHGGGWYGGWYGPSVGLYLGSPYWWGGWPYYYPYGYGWPYGYGYGYSYSAPYAYVPREPSVYIEEAPQTAAPHYWYYCTSPAGYYPYVQRCTKPWMTVLPQDVPGVSGAPASAAPPGEPGGSK